MSLEIETNISFKTLDYLLLQSIAEMKLDRDLDKDPNIKISFYKTYKNKDTNDVI